MADWEIKKTLGQCFGTNQLFEVGQDYYAALVETEQGLERRDFSIEYWDQMQSVGFLFLESRMANPEQKKKMFIDDEMRWRFSTDWPTKPSRTKSISALC
jgi:hypothetical protein